jgi:iron complex transport system permease protein
VVLGLRVPRVLSAFGIGALLAMAGVLLQALFRNPLADSYVLGVSGGSALGALLALLVGGSLWLVQCSAASGAIFATLLVLVLARGGGTVRVLLTGVVLASACGALVTLILVLADNGQLRGMMFWLAGDLGWAAQPWAMAVTALLATIAITLIARPLDVLATGETTAQSLGLNLDRWRVLIVIIAGLLTAGAVIQGGTIGFVGMVVPHLVRLAFGTAAHRVVAPAAALAGGTLLAAADFVARTAAAPRQLPVGAIMALLGVPVFLLLLRRLEPRF